MCVNCRRIWDTRLQSVSLSPKALEEKSTVGNTLLLPPGWGLSSPMLGGAAFRSCVPTTRSHPGILIYLSAWLWGLLGLPQHTGF